MGQRLNISIRENDKILASGYWHWGGFTNSALGILSEMVETINEFDKSDNWKDYYSSTEIAVGFLERCGCGVFNNRNGGRMRIGRNQDTSEGNIIIDLEFKTIKLINIINEYSHDLEDTIFEFGFAEVEDYINQILESDDDFELDGKQYFKIA